MKSFYWSKNWREEKNPSTITPSWRQKQYFYFSNTTYSFSPSADPKGYSFIQWSYKGDFYSLHVYLIFTAASPPPFSSSFFFNILLPFLSILLYLPCHIFNLINITTLVCIISDYFSSQIIGGRQDSKMTPNKTCPYRSPTPWVWVGPMNMIWFYSCN